MKWKAFCIRLLEELIMTQQILRRKYRVYKKCMSKPDCIIGKENPFIKLHEWGEFENFRFNHLILSLWWKVASLFPIVGVTVSQLRLGARLLRCCQKPETQQETSHPRHHRHPCRFLCSGTQTVKERLRWHLIVSTLSPYLVVYLTSEPELLTRSSEFLKPTTT